MTLLGRMPDLAVSFACAAWHAQEHAFQQLASVAKRTARERIAHLLLDVNNRAHAGSPGTPAPLPLTQEHIADAVGLTSVHVSRVLKELRADGIVSTRGHVLDILDRARLGEAAGVHPALP